jgi:hypothetical protein
MSSEFARKIIEDAAEMSDGDLTREQFSTLYDVINRDCRLMAAAETLYFVIGNFDTERDQREHVESVKDCISEYQGLEAFLLDDVDPEDEALKNWYLKFRVFDRRSDHVVGVFEDNDGGHE